MVEDEGGRESGRMFAVGYPFRLGRFLDDRLGVHWMFGSRGMWEE